MQYYINVGQVLKESIPKKFQWVFSKSLVILVLV